MIKKRKITCITGTRADYPRVKSVLREIINRKNFDLSLIVTGSHLLNEYGYSAQEIIDEFEDINITNALEEILKEKINILDIQGIM